jgi:protein phosphatase
MIPIERAHLHVAAITDPGKAGKNNEDRYSVSAYRVSRDRKVDALVALVADGVGGHRAGEVAAELAVETISQVVAASNASDPRAILDSAFQRANQVIYEQSLQNQALQGMSTTCVCAWVSGDRLYAASVGDSRLYLVRNKTITCLTTDHTWVQEAIEAGAITPEQARQHPNAHIIRRHLGSPQPVVPDYRLRLRPDLTDIESEANQGMRLLPGDELLLCSDGLTDLVGDEEILAAVAGQDLEKSLHGLVDLANARGGYDNITAIGMRVPRRLRDRRQSCLLGILGGLIALVLLVILLGGAYAWLIGQIGTTTATPIQAKLTQSILASPLGSLTQPVSLSPSPEPTFVTPSPTSGEPVTPSGGTATVTQMIQVTPSPVKSPSQLPSEATYTAWPTSTSLPGTP